MAINRRAAVGSAAGERSRPVAADVAAEKQRRAPQALAKPHLRPVDCAGDRQELGAVRHFDRIDDDLAGLREGGVDAPASDNRRRSAPAETLRTGAAQAVSREVYLDQEKRHAGVPGRAASSGDSPPARGAPKRGSQPIDVVASAGLPAETLVRHHHRKRGIAGKFETGDAPPSVGRQRQRFEFGGNRARIQRGSLRGDLPQLVEGRQSLRDEQALRVAVVAPAQLGMVATGSCWTRYRARS